MVARGITVGLPLETDCTDMGTATLSTFDVLVGTMGVVGMVGINWVAGAGLVLPVAIPVCGVPCDRGCCCCCRALARVAGSGVPLGMVVAVTMPRGTV